MQSTPNLTPVDVLVVGGGAIGLACALALRDAGRSVRLIEAAHVGAGASHGNCGTITPSHAPPLASPGMVGTALRFMLQPDAPLYIKPRFDPRLWAWLLHFAGRCNVRDWEASARSKSALLNHSRARLADWVHAKQLDCEFVEAGEDYIFRDARRMAHDLAEVPLLRELGVAVEEFDGPAYEAREPALKPGLAGALRFSGDASLRPDRYVDELARVFVAGGGELIEQCALQDLEEAINGVRVQTSRGTFDAGQVVCALGAWSPRMADAIGMRGLRRAMQPGKGYSITYDPPARVPKHPLVLRERQVCVTAWERGYRLGSTMEFSGYDDTLNARRLGALERGAAEYLHEPVGRLVRERWFGWRPMCADDVPLIGRVPGRSRTWLATAHGMMGIGMSVATGELIADLVTGRAPTLDPKPYDPVRFA
ncbi:D-amino-acid dehydrogenase [Lysobacter helvus]|uniref:D-amino-acid dehydrogenase n=2 Tax=Lysobacteraceae TaxID=32033 RepID=A0ABM7Q291_9GAMM|nr:MULTISPECIES: FAD-dependent oxidoreductase [Lysobacter]BCT91358.1 D-amino-acid dehydrogenase [Lysobacter caseinilyticus]BCT94511.1 D-amino-acid dehydrogenase [Lysobacter helvus]